MILIARKAFVDECQELQMFSLASGVVAIVDVRVKPAVRSYRSSHCSSRCLTVYGCDLWPPPGPTTDVPGPFLWGPAGESWTFPKRFREYCILVLWHFIQNLKMHPTFPKRNTNKLYCICRWQYFPPTLSSWLQNILEEDKFVVIFSPVINNKL